MELIVLGSGTGWPRRERNAAGYLVRAAGKTVLLDFGPGILRRLTEAGVDINEIDFIFLSHWHPDHVADLTPYLFATRYRLGFTRNRPVRLISAEGFGAFLSALRGAYGHWLDPPEGLVEILERPRGKRSKLALEGLEWETAPARHNPESLAVRLSAEGRALVYTGDTEYSPEVVDLARGADLMIAECAFPEELPVAGHSTPSVAARMAEEAGLKRLLLSHFYPPCEEADLLSPARKFFSGEILLAQDLQKIKI
ncbi:MBL fold metallo-hydrolase [Thermosulfurimonas marina]|uniref:MBL fold metallo-hydrolase n=1 Tax=Thermosulfurimonas marina TaxID=2047767 RepID=A0A6H1WSH1_9BACT|nr:MBL fold metallo-hydrolase [Thermosulfurimonas marina]QJA06120.1 MBL fold metallo-hydrolase [Thermosulfurimonas marina]